jgi:CDP-diacylglycerol--glycerol-3-phosphate 3-phosphatidyltransferase
MTTANKITILRIFLIPFFVVEILYYVKAGHELYRFLALLSFAVAAILDGVDGYVARRYHQRSELGAVLDPLADKLLLVSAIVLLSIGWPPYFQTVPLWLTGIIIGRDALLIAGLGVIHIMVGKTRVRPRFVGKSATVLQMITVIWILLRWDSRVLQVWTIGAGACTAVSGFLYVLDGMKQLGAHPTSSATAKENL